MNLFENIPNITEDMLSPQYKELRDNVMLTNERKIIEHWAEDFTDLDGNFRRDFQKSFRPQMWELYLHALFKKANFKRNMDYPAPDYIIESPFEFYVEAATANFRQDGPGEADRTYEQFDELTKPAYMFDDYEKFLNESISRLSKKVNDKNQAYNKYLHNKSIRSDLPYVIAIGAHDQLESGREFIYPMFALLYGYYHEPKENNYTLKNKIQVGSKEIDVNLFSQKRYENISAILYSCTVTIGKLTALAISQGMQSVQSVCSFHEILDGDDHFKYTLKEVTVNNPEKLEEGVFIFHNPNAKNPLDENAFSNLAVTQFFLEEDGINYKGNISPLVVRKSFSRLTETGEKIKLQEHLRMYNRATPENFYDIE